MNKITKNDRDEITAALTAWAKTNKAKFVVGGTEEAPTMYMHKGDWSLEIIPEDGWAFVHGNGSLSGLSTNIGTIDEFDEAVKRLLGKGDK